MSCHPDGVLSAAALTSFLVLSTLRVHENFASVNIKKSFLLIVYLSVLRWRINRRYTGRRMSQRPRFKRIPVSWQYDVKRTELYGSIWGLCCSVGNCLRSTWLMKGDNSQVFCCFEVPSDWHSTKSTGARSFDVRLEIIRHRYWRLCKWSCVVERR